jgi:hypothetical protein
MLKELSYVQFCELGSHTNAVAVPLGITNECKIIKSAVITWG